MKIIDSRVRLLGFKFFFPSSWASKPWTYMLLHGEVVVINKEITVLYRNHLSALHKHELLVLPYLFIALNTDPAIVWVLMKYLFIFASLAKFQKEKTHKIQPILRMISVDT